MMLRVLKQGSLGWCEIATGGGLFYKPVQAITKSQHIMVSGITEKFVPSDRGILTCYSI